MRERPHKDAWPAALPSPSDAGRDILYIHTVIAAAVIAPAVPWPGVPTTVFT